ncbi:MAG: site-specific DNA-methyltransferase [Planctomycetaceae bacterium]|jgi:DNA modification methylase|nr:site-specific DNA-methyltransferase [Planctomycetaceae bacterium]
MPDKTLFPINKLILGDNLEILKKLDDASVDLIYLDPPFFSNRNYEIIWGDEGEIRSFKDRWSGGIDHYIAWLKERVEQMYRVLKPTGSLFLHCDWHADAHIRVEILEKIFGYDNIRGHIIWQRTNAHNDARKKIAVLSDTIWYYSKSERITYNPVFGKLGEKYINDFYKYDDGDGKGRYRLGDLTNTKPDGYNYEYKGYKPNANGWRCPLETMQKWDEEDLIKYPKSKEGRLSIKRYLDNSNGALLGNLWTDINNVQPGKERIGYPTQKPEALLERIIKMASNEGDVVLDPFVGGGTTIAVAEKLGRFWIGIDQSVQAVKVTELRLLKQLDLFSNSFITQLHKYDYDTLRYKDAFKFEEWIVQQFGGTSNAKQRGDFGLDGKMPDNTPIQVKRSDNVGRNVIDNFLSAIQRSDKKLFTKHVKESKPAGYVIAFSFGKGAVQEVARLKNQENIVIKLVTVEEIVPIAKKPAIHVEVNELKRDAKGIREIEFIATGQSDAGIEFYSWDFAYKEEKGFKPAVIIDKEGRQRQKFKAGQHRVAVKVVDNDGLESMEVIQLKVNGHVEWETPEK